MDQRKEARLDLEFQVRVWGVDRMAQPFAELGRASRVSNGGAVLIGLRSKLRPGALLDVQHGARRAQFRIVWIAPGETGVQALPFEPCIWGVAMPKTSEMVGIG